MRIQERRLRQLIREELIREMDPNANMDDSDSSRPRSRIDSDEFKYLARQFDDFIWGVDRQPPASIKDRFTPSVKATIESDILKARSAAEKHVKSFLVSPQMAGKMTAKRAELSTLFPQLIDFLEDSTRAYLLGGPPSRESLKDIVDRINNTAPRTQPYSDWSGPTGSDHEGPQGQVGILIGMYANNLEVSGDIPPIVSPVRKALNLLAS